MYLTWNHNLSKREECVNDRPTKSHSIWSVRFLMICWHTLQQNQKVSPSSKIMPFSFLPRRKLPVCKNAHAQLTFITVRNFSLIFLSEPRTENFRFQIPKVLSTTPLPRRWNELYPQRSDFPFHIFNAFSLDESALNGMKNQISMAVSFFSWIWGFWLGG